MKPTRYLIGIVCSVLVGTLLGKALFPKPEIAAPNGEAAGKREASNVRISALPAGGGLGMAPDEVFASIAEGRASSNPSRSHFETRLKLRAMSDAEMLRLAERLVAGEFELTQYESFVVTEVWKRYAAIDPAAAHRDALLLGTRIMRADAASIAAKAWVVVDPAGALAKFIANESGGATEISTVGVALKALVGEDPAGAIAVLEEHSGEDWYGHARRLVFSAWSDADSEAAREWLLEGMREDPASTGRVLNDLAGKDPVGALDMAMGMEPDARLRESVGEIITGRWMWHDRAAALNALESLPDEWHSRRAAENFGRNGVIETPLEELDAMAAMFPTAELREEFWQAALGRRASDSNFGDAVALLQRLPAGRARGEGAADVATSWAKLNPAEASEWVASLPPGPQRDGAAGGLARTIAPLDPASARTWAESISNDELRTQILESL